MKLISGLAAVVLAGTTLAPSLSAPASAATPAEAAAVAGDWIAGEVTEGLAAGDFDYYPGQLIDAGFALRATGHLAKAEGVAASLAPMLVTTEPYQYGYARSTEYDTWTDPEADPVLLQVGRYANATAKAAAFTERIGLDASTRYPDIDLVAQLEDLTDDATGRIADDSAFGDYANTIGQSFAVEALARAGSAEADAATGTLLARQCPAGFFPLSLDGACPAAETLPDVTALAVISLVESGITSDDVTTAVDDATAWLESLQLADGSFPGDGGAAGANTNGTGLAGWALGVAGRTSSAGRAAAWTRALQVGDVGACATQAPNGAIAFNAADYESGRKDGLGPKRTTWRIASFQAAPALAWAPAASAPLGISTPATAGDGATVTATVRGLGAGEHACVALGTDARSVTGTGDELTVDFRLPAGPGSHTFSVTTLAGTQTSTTMVAQPATPAPMPTAPPTTDQATPALGALRVARVERVERHRLRLDVRCRGAATCSGTLVVRSKRAVATAHGAQRRVVVARKTYTVEPGATERVVLTVRRPARVALRMGKVRVVAAQRAAGADTVRTAFWLKRA